MDSDFSKIMSVLFLSANLTGHEMLITNFLANNLRKSMFFVKSYLLGCSLLPSIRMNLVLTHSKDDKIYTLDMKKNSVQVCN